MPYRNYADKLAYMREYNAANRERQRDYQRMWRESNVEKRADYHREYAKANPETKKAAVRRYQEKKKQDPVWRAEQTAKMRAWRAANPERNRENLRLYRKLKSETDLNFVIKNRLRARLHKKLANRGIRKVANTMALTGCTAEFLRGYLERMFTEGMSWDNFGLWNIDHHIPCAEFDLRDPEQQKQCFHYSNLRPLWAADNFSKGAKRPK